MTGAVDSDAGRASVFIRRLLDGSGLNGIAPADCGEWEYLCRTIASGYEASGREGAVAVWNVAVKKTPSLYGLLSGSPAPATSTAAVPALPATATAIYDQANPASAGAWLDEYVSYAAQVAPLMTRNFHQAAGLVALSVAVARRAVLRWEGKELYPNLYVLFVGPSGYGKTTSMRILQRVLHASGLSRMLFPDETTPETMLNEMSTVIPAAYKGWDRTTQLQWLRQRAHAAQRTWLVDEVQSLFASFNREYMAGALGRLLSFYDCPEETTRQTTSGGRITVSDVYFSFFGAGTPDGMQPHFQNEQRWKEGLWARFALLMPDRRPIWVESSGESVDMPQRLTSGLRAIYQFFDVPEAVIEGDSEGKREWVAIRNATSPVSIQLGEGVFAAWRAYRKAVAFDLQPAVEECLQPSYIRFAEQAMKIAMLLAIADAATQDDLVVTLAHYARGQQIAEEWRTALHTLWRSLSKTEEEQLTDRIIRFLRKNGRADKRSLQQNLHRKAAEIETAIKTLTESGLVDAFRTGKATYYGIAEGSDVPE